MKINHFWGGGCVYDDTHISWETIFSHFRHDDLVRIELLVFVSKFVRVLIKICVIVIF